jgi:multicomponent Na+:H+ antiporter subunit E
MTLSLIVRMGMFALLWWIFTEDAPNSWWMGGVLVLLAASISVRMTPPQTFSFKGIYHFVPFFIRYSLKGGIDVAWRALRPNMAISPTLITYPMRLPSGPPQIFMTNAISLLPGTLATDLIESVLKVHVLDAHGTYQSDLELLEEKIAALYNIPLRSPDSAITQNNNVTDHP